MRRTILLFIFLHRKIKDDICTFFWQYVGVCFSDNWCVFFLNKVCVFLTIAVCFSDSMYVFYNTLGVCFSAKRYVIFCQLVCVFLTIGVHFSKNSCVIFQNWQGGARVHWAGNWGAWLQVRKQFPANHSKDDVKISW